MKVKVTVLAQGAYCSMVSEDGPHFALDVLLPAGKGVSSGLLERAAEYEQKAARLSAYAERCRQAALIVST